MTSQENENTEAEIDEQGRNPTQRRMDEEGVEDVPVDREEPEAVPVDAGEPGGGR